ncbi:MAG: RICIN domain-containing protein [Chthoniobacteraceae bacterium]
MQPLACWAPRRPARPIPTRELRSPPADLATIKANLTQAPWKTGYAALQADSRSSLSYTMQGPFTEVSRSPNVNLTQWRNDMTAIWNLARMWYFTGNTAYAQKAHDILISWATTNTLYDGGEAGLDLGDYAFMFVGGADILRGTWSGWTSSDTTTVQNWFNTVLMPDVYHTDYMFGAANKGALHLVAAGLMAMFDDDSTSLNLVLYQYRTLAHIGLRSSDGIGEVGDSGRDEGHAYEQFKSLSMLAEAFWSQGIDVFTDNNSSLMAAGEYFARNNYLATTPFLPFGTTDAYYTTGVAGGWSAGRMGLDILHSAYVVRLGLRTPYTDLQRQQLPVDEDSFVFVKSADAATATAPSAITFPAATSLTTGVSNAEIGNATPAGSSAYSSGVWTVQGAGSDIWGTADNCHFTYKAVTGDFAIVAKVNGISSTSTSAKAGLMIRPDLTSGNTRAWIAVTNKSTVEQNFQTLSGVYGGSNYATKSLSITTSGTYWLKIERLSNIITGYISQDGTNWAATDVSASYDSIPDTLDVGLVLCSVTNGTLATGTFSNVQITGGDGGAPVVTPAAPAAFLAAPDTGSVVLRWQTSFGATSYTVSRSTTSGGSYSTVASGITTNGYTDTTVTNGTTYYYVVTATNSVGTSANSTQDSATPQSAMVNVASGGTATASANGSSSTQGAAQAFDGDPGTKWFNGNGGTTGWIEYDFGSSLTPTIKRYTINAANDVPGRDPVAWQFQGSSDGSTWTTLDTESAQTFTLRYQANTYNIASPTAYRYYRLNVTANNGDSTGLQLSELALLTDQGTTIPNGTYRLLNRRSNKAFEVSSGSTTSGAALDQWSYGAATSQQWTLTDQGSGQYQILGVASGLAVDVSGASTANGASLIIWPWSGANNQRWTITPTGDGFFKLTAVHSGKVVDVNSGSTANGATLIQYPYSGGTNQQWLISTP